MKLKQQHNESLITLVQEGYKAGDRVRQILVGLNAQESIRKIGTCSKPAVADLDEQALVRVAINCVGYAEDAALQLARIVEEKAVTPTEEHLTLLIEVQRLGARLYRDMWEIALTEQDSNNLRLLLKKVAMVTVWEDLPCTVAGHTYKYVRNGMTGTVAFEHAYGVSFIEYKQGKAEKGWTVLRETLEESVALARSEMDRALKLLLPQT